MAEEIKPNSHAYKAEQQKKASENRKVVHGDVKRKKKSLAKRAEGAMLSENAETVKDYLIWDVLIPALRDTVVDLGKKALDAIFYGDRRTSTSNIERKRSTSYVRYDKASYEDDRPYSSRSRRSSRNLRAMHDFDDIVLDSRGDAEQVLDLLVESTMQYGMVSVADFYELVGLDVKYTDWRWGWYELSKARVERVREGYVIMLPRPVMLDDDSRDEVPWR